MVIEKKFIKDILSFRDENIVSDELYSETNTYIKYMLETYHKEWDRTYVDDIIAQTWFYLIKSIDTFTIRTNWYVYVKLSLVRAMWRDYSVLVDHIRIPSNYKRLINKYDSMKNSGYYRAEIMTALYKTPIQGEIISGKDTIDKIIETYENKVSCIGLDFSYDNKSNVAPEGYMNLSRGEIKRYIEKICTGSRIRGTYLESVNVDLRIICLELYVYPILFNTGIFKGREIADVAQRSVSRVMQLSKRLMSKIANDEEIKDMLIEYYNLK